MLSKLIKYVIAVEHQSPPHHEETEPASGNIQMRSDDVACDELRADELMIYIGTARLLTHRVGDVDHTRDGTSFPGRSSMQISPTEPQL